MYGGLNNASCLPCPSTSTNEGGYSVASCQCLLPNNPCIGKYVHESVLTFLTFVSFVDVIFYNPFCCVCYVQFCFTPVALFELPQYEFDANVCSPFGTMIFEVEFFVSSMGSGAIDYMEFSISGDQGFLINGTESPLVVQPPFQLRYPLTVSLGRGRDVNEVSEYISFEMVAFVNTSSGATVVPRSNITLRKLGECFHLVCSVLICIFIFCSYSGKNVRLVNGAVPNEGRLEARNGLNGVWGTVCDDFFGETEAQVACRQLGYISDGAIAYERGHFGRGTGPIYLDDLLCLGTESRIFDCPGADFETNCHHIEDVGVYCSPGKKKCIFNKIQQSLCIIPFAIKT